MKSDVFDDPFYQDDEARALEGCNLVSEAEKIKTLVGVAQETGLTVDFLDQLTVGLSKSDFLRVMSNASGMPSYMKSKDSPYVFRSARAPANPT